MERSSDDRSDADLVSEILLGRGREESEVAYRTLLRRYWKVVVVLLRSRLPAGRDAEDVAQESFIRAWRSIDKLENPRLFLSWLLQIARNLATDESRRRRGEVSLDGIGDDGDERRWQPVSELPPADAAIERREEWSTVERALAVLPDRYRTVVVLRYLHGMSNQEMAKSLGEPEGTIRNRLFRALGKLRVTLEGSEVHKP